MENKKFRLPKKFATEWISALRSGDYIQGQKYLAINTGNKMRYCCMGVAARVAGIPDSQIQNEHYIRSHMPGSDKVPEELIDYFIKGRICYVLSKLNDGVYMIDINPDGKSFAFFEIADWLEENVEFYEED